MDCIAAKTEVILPQAQSRLLLRRQVSGWETPGEFIYTAYLVQFPQWPPGHSNIKEATDLYAVAK
jgi:hypothetical protein